MVIIEEKEKKSVENILPLVNIVFLLLIFFMVAGSFVQPEHLRVNLPTATLDKAAPKNITTIVMGSTNAFSIGNKSYTEAALIVHIEDNITEYDHGIIQLKADQAVSANAVIKLLNQLSHTGLTSIQLLTHPTAFKPS